MNFKISLAQLHIYGGDPDRNLQTAVQMIDQAAADGSHFILFPELWSSGYDLENAARHALKSPEILAELKRLATARQIIIGGSLLESTPQGLYNTFSWIDPSASEIIAYRKIHLFRLMDEEKWLNPGNSLRTVQAPWGATGLAICYDLRFPELFRSYVLQGAQGLLLSAEWPVRRIYHWQTLLRARAIENQCFVFAANCAGPVFNEQFGGCSTVVTPWGETLVEGSQSGQELLTVEIDTGLVAQARNFMPIFQDRRPDLYSF
ncbi:MAG TPA: carbon-nitrogen family hydrolase [Anaerolineaceae bacterium]|jgi:predicted amidohydrolase